MEFCFMCGETAVQTITASLEEYAPKLLQYVGYEETESIGEKEMITVLELWIDQSDRQDQELKLLLFSLFTK